MRSFRFGLVEPCLRDLRAAAPVHRVGPASIRACPPWDLDVVGASYFKLTRSNCRDASFSFYSRAINLYTVWNISCTRRKLYTVTLMSHKGMLDNDLYRPFSTG